jgi:Ankyrin repeats (3 copies)/Ankyrin repeat
MAEAAELMAAVAAGDADAVARLLAEDPSLAAARGEDGVSAVLLARYRFDRSTLDLLLAADPELDVFEAAALGRLDRLKDRLAAVTDAAMAYSPDGFAALHLAAFFGKAEAVQVLLEAGASVAAYTRNDFANQPLHAAAAGRHVEVCRLLLAAGADVSATQHGGYAPLHEAAQHGDAEMVELFLSAGGDPTASITDGRTPVELAAEAGHHDVARRLREVAEGRHPGPSTALR